MPTPHISAQPGDFAPAVLMPGDPKRAQRMAEAILDDAHPVTDVRGALGFTGRLAAPGPGQGQLLSIMGSGMGMASMGIYATELFRFYGVERIVRVGTAGGISPKLEVGHLVVAVGAHTPSSMNESRLPGVHFSASADLTMAAAAWALAQTESEPVWAGSVVSTDHFYFSVPGQLAALENHGVLAVEMETAALYGVAAEFDRAALSVLTVSDHLTKSGREMSAAERETHFQGALRLAVAAAFA
ncbi:MAG: purine-nucleoside phosphorylase [Propionibacteriaceae bacterium]|jgi:purine-nucleoside phosphorylase|nr:purine-nucleoside phosphorylase [Propionibacteriaceae bacterium]